MMLQKAYQMCPVSTMISITRFSNSDKSFMDTFGSIRNIVTSALIFSFVYAFFSITHDLSLLYYPVRNSQSNQSCNVNVTKIPIWSY